MTARPGDSSRTSPDSVTPRRLAILVSMTSPDAARLAVRAGIDTVILDGEHGHPLGSEVAAMAAAIHEAGGRCLIRLAGNQTHHIGPLLDNGLDGLVLSGVEDLGQMRHAAMAAWYPPRGSRSVNPFVPAAGSPGDEAALVAGTDRLELWAMAETESFLEGLRSGRDDVGKEPWLANWTGLIVGPYDLAASMGYEASPDDARLVAAVRDYVDIAARAGLASGLFSRSPEVHRRWRDCGVEVDFVIVGYDRDIWYQELRARVEAVGDVVSDAPEGHSDW
jgi:4-hydroxy-2-oxoheptanedioate aldolase